MNKTVRNPIIGHRIEFLQTADQTNGELLQIMYTVEKPETKPAIPLHFHSQCAERFEVVNGRLGVVLDGKQHQLGIGEEVKIPSGTPHTFWNAVRASCAFSPMCVRRANCKPIGRQSLV